MIFLQDGARWRLYLGPTLGDRCARSFHIPVAPDGIRWRPIACSSPSIHGQTKIMLWLDRFIRFLA